MIFWKKTYWTCLPAFAVALLFSATASGFWPIEIYTGDNILFSNPVITIYCDRDSDCLSKSERCIEHKCIDQCVDSDVQAGDIDEQTLYPGSVKSWDYKWFSDEFDWQSKKAFDSCKGGFAGKELIVEYVCEKAGSGMIGVPKVRTCPDGWTCDEKASGFGYKAAYCKPPCDPTSDPCCKNNKIDLCCKNGISTPCCDSDTGIVTGADQCPMDGCQLDWSLCFDLCPGIDGIQSQWPAFGPDGQGLCVDPATTPQICADPEPNDTLPGAIVFCEKDTNGDGEPDILYEITSGECPGKTFIKVCVNPSQYLYITCDDKDGLYKADLHTCPTPPGICQLGNCLGVSSGCVDSGDEHTIAEFIFINGKNVKGDQCIGNSVQEFKCDTSDPSGFSTNGDPYPCNAVAPNMICKFGACTKPDCIVDSDCPPDFVCADNICVKEGGATCICPQEIDATNDPLVKDTFTPVLFKDGVETPLSPVEDHCADLNNVYEEKCGPFPDSACHVAEKTPCPAGTTCHEGLCTSCYDSDTADAIDKKGTVYYGNGTVDDHCVDNDLNQVSCMYGQMVPIPPLYCTTGCVEGACPLCKDDDQENDPYKIGWVKFYKDNEFHIKGDQCSGQDPVLDPAMKKLTQYNCSNDGQPVGSETDCLCGCDPALGACAKDSCSSLLSNYISFQNKKFCEVHSCSCAGGVMQEVVTPYCPAGQLCDEASQSCKCQNSCPIGQVPVPVSCICSPVECDIGFVLDPATGQCVPNTAACKFDQIATGDLNTCAVRDGYVYCWGENSTLIDGFVTTIYPSETVIWLDSIKKVAMGEKHACALGENGNAYCWGSNKYGQDGGIIEGNDAVPWDVGISDVADIDLGYNFSCALKKDGSIWCWGINDGGGLGVGSLLPKVTTPTQVVGISDASALAAGLYHACALRQNGEVWCWGLNAFETLGVGSGAGWISEPMKVLGLTGEITKISANGHTCAIKKGGSVLCWGAGGGSMPNSVDSSPVQVQGLTGIKDISVGIERTCVIKDDDTLWCWGINEYAAMGVASNDIFVPLPLQVQGLEDVRSVSAGDDYTCAIKKDYTVYCWGNNTYGKLGIQKDLPLIDVAKQVTPIVCVLGCKDLGFQGGSTKFDANGSVNADECWCIKLPKNPFVSEEGMILYEAPKDLIYPVEQPTGPDDPIPPNDYCAQGFVPKSGQVCIDALTNLEMCPVIWGDDQEPQATVKLIDGMYKCEFADKDSPYCPEGANYFGDVNLPDTYGQFAIGYSCVSDQPITNVQCIKAGFAVTWNEYATKKYSELYGAYVFSCGMGINAICKQPAYYYNKPYSPYINISLEVATCCAKVTDIQAGLFSGDVPAYVPQDQNQKYPLQGDYYKIPSCISGFPSCPKGTKPTCGVGGNVSCNDGQPKCLIQDQHPQCK